MMTRRLARTALFVFLLFALFAALVQVPAASAQTDPKQLFAGKKIQFIVPFGPGGGYDTSARILAPFIEKHIGAKVIIRNITGAGGLNGINAIWKAKPNGLTIGLVTGIGAYLNQVAGSKGVKFDLRKFIWLGRISPTPNVLAVSAESSFKTIEDIVRSNRPLKMGSTGRGSAMTVLAELLAKVFGFNVKHIFGYGSTSEIFVSILRGDTDFIATVYDSVLRAVKAGQLRPILYLDMQKSDLYPNTPSFNEIKLSKDKLIYARTISSLGSFGRLVAAPPKVKEKTAAALKQAVWQAINDPDFAIAAKKVKQDVDPADSETVSALINETLSVPPEIQNVIREAF